MPCTYEGYPEPAQDTHNGEVAELLCQLMADHEARNEMSCFTKPQLAWWEEHKKRDIARLQQDLEDAAEKHQRRAVLAKLTPYERKLLGV